MSQEPPEWLNENIIEASKHTSRIHIFFVGFIFFCTLTLLGTSDRQIILDEQTILPLVGSNVSFSGFCVSVAIMSICIFAYLQMYLQKHRSLILKLKNDYKQIDSERIYPWIVTIAEENQQCFVGFIHKILVECSVWYLLPIFLSIIPYWFVKTHRPILSYIFALAPILGVWFVITYRAQYERVTFLKLLKSKKSLTACAIIIIAWSIFLSCFCIPWAMRGKTIFWKRGPLNAFHKPALWDLKSFLGSWWCVDLSRQNLIKKPDLDFPTNYWLELPGVHLEGANLSGSILNRANLEDAYLQNAVASHIK